MTDFLAELERELLAAHPKRRAARRKATAGRALRAAPVALIVTAVVGGAGTFVVSTANEHENRVATPPPKAGAPADPGRAWGGEVAVLNTTTRAGIAGDVADFLLPDHEVGTVTNASFRGHELSTVMYAPGHRDQARSIARTLDAELRELMPEVAEEGEGGDVVVLVAKDVRRVGTRRLNGPDAAGSVSALRLRDGHVALRVEGAGLRSGTYTMFLQSSRRTRSIGTAGKVGRDGVLRARALLEDVPAGARLAVTRKLRAGSGAVAALSGEVP